MKLWTFIGAEVWAPQTCDNPWCECEPPQYGPFLRWERDPSHHGTTQITRSGGVVSTCECGWQDFAVNWPAHLDEVAPLRAVYS